MAQGTPVYPGGSNTYVKNHDATGRLTVAFSRNPNKFPLARYGQYAPVDQDAGYYLKINIEEAGRLVGGDLDAYVWPDGADRPRSNSGTEKFSFADYRTERMNYDFELGDKAANQATWDIKPHHIAIQSQKAMTARTRRTVQALSNTASWDASHISAVASIPGVTGRWDLSTTQRADIKRSLNHGHKIIETDTLATVTREQLHLVVGADTARAMGESQEILDYIKGSPQAYAQVKGDLPNFNKEYGLPEELYGIPVTVENSVMVTSRRGATPVKTYVMQDGDAFLISRVGALEEGVAGAPTFSTLTIFLFEELTVEQKDDRDNRRQEGHVVDDFHAVLTAPVSGFYFQTATG